MVQTAGDQAGTVKALDWNMKIRCRMHRTLRSEDIRTVLFGQNPCYKLIGRAHGDADITTDCPMKYARIALFVMFLLTLGRFMWFATTVDFFGLALATLALVITEIGKIVHKARSIAMRDLSAAKAKLEQTTLTMENAVKAGLELERKVQTHEGRLLRIEAGPLIGGLKRG